MSLLKFLFLGCGDLRSPLATAIGAKKNQYLHIHINDNNLVVIARNILILKIMSTPEFNPNKKADLDYLWHLWYDATWPESTLKRFMQDIKDLLDQPLPQSIFIPESHIHIERLRNLWTEWLSLVQTTSVEQVLSERYGTLTKSILNISCSSCL